MIECYYTMCPHHECNHFPDDGPYCYYDECSATPEDIEEYDEHRQNQLKKFYMKEIK